MAHGKASNQSLYSDNDLSSRVRKKVRNAGPSATTMCNAFRREQKENPSLIFSEWKRAYLREHDRKRREKRKK
jgi:hypothetical protein